MSKRHSWLRIIGVQRWDASVEPLILDLTTLCFHVQQHAGYVRLILHILQTDTKQPLDCKASPSEAAVFSTIDTLYPASLCCGAPSDKSCTGEYAFWPFLDKASCLRGSSNSVLDFPPSSKDGGDCDMDILFFTRCLLDV
jgi:hypothetical protein